jgi:hypothetical protein
MTEPTRTIRSHLLALTVCLVCGLSPVRGATLVGRFDPVPTGTEVDLTVEGPLDWVHWGLYTDSSIDRKAGVPPQIPDYVPIKMTGPFQYADNYNGYSWRDGTPTPSKTNTPTGVWMYGKGSGFELQFPADTTLKTFKIYVGTFGAVGEFTATLTGAPKYSDASITNFSNGPGGVYTLDVRADTPGQVLDIKYLVGQTFDTAGNVTLQAAALTAPGANNPPAVSISDPADGANFSANDNVPISADAADLDGTIGKVEFFQSSDKLGESTNNPYSLTWSNAPSGDYWLTARATDNGGATRTSAAVKIFANGTGGTLAGRVGLPTNSAGRYDIDLTVDGTADWAQWGLSSPTNFNHKAGVPQQISNLTIIGTNNTQRLDDYVTQFSWSDGIPIASAAPTKTGVFINGPTNGFRITAPADTSERTLKVYVGLYGAEGKFQAYLSDHSAPAYTDTSLSSIYGNDPAVYILDYRAASSGQTLIVEWTVKALFDLDYGNVSLEAATLSGANMPTNAPPTVMITSPTNGATFTTPADIPITAEASDSDGRISLVEFFHNDTKLGEATNSPYTFRWTNVASGNYTLTAKATDDLEATSSSSPVSITVANPNAPPNVTIISPTNNATFTAPADIAITADPSDSDGTISLVEFFQNDTKLGEATNSPYIFSWTNVTAGNYALTARARDNLGATNSSSTIRITVIRSNTPPTVAITNPTNNTLFRAPANISIQADASDTDGTVSKVEFFEGLNRLGESTNAPYSIVWSNALAGSYSLTARATDDAGSVATSFPVNVTVNSNSAAPVTLLSPLASNNRFSFSFATESNRIYVVEHTTTLSPVNWQTLTNMLGDGSVVTATDTIQAETPRFYRVKAE